MITTDDVRQIVLFAGVTDEQAERIATLAADVRLREQDWIAREGETGAFFGLLSGQFAITKLVRGHQRLLDIRDAGSYFGEVPVLLDAPFMASGQALTPVRLLRLTTADFLAVAAAIPELQDQLRTSFLDRVGSIEQTTLLPQDLPIVVGSQDELECHHLRDFLARNFVEYRWLDPTQTPDRQHIPEAILASDRSPVLLLPDGTTLFCPTPRAVAEAVGLQTVPRGTQYDVIIIGGGPSGLAAAVYGASEGLRTLLVEGFAPGGQAGMSSRIENYLGFPIGLSGDELGSRALSQAQRFGAEIVVTRTVATILPGTPHHTITLEDGATLQTRAIVLASGVNYRALDIPDLGLYEGAGVYYGAARTEALAMRGRQVYLIGGGNSAGQAAMFFANYAAQVTILVRGASLAASMSSYLIDQLYTRGNIAVRTSTELIGVHGHPHLEAITLRDHAQERDEQVTADGVFIFIGAIADTNWLPAMIARDVQGYILTGRDIPIDLWPATTLQRDPLLLETSVPTIFATGDVRHGSVKRVAAGVGEGSMAIAFIHQVLAGQIPAEPTGSTHKT